MQPDAPMMTSYKGVTPFVLADIVKLPLLVWFLSITLWLVSTMGTLSSGVGGLI
jgi:TRAP-type C4-dicarboxylate transport system permease large subunit